MYYLYFVVTGGSFNDLFCTSKWKPIMKYFCFTIFFFSMTCTQRENEIPRHFSTLVITNQ